MKSFFKNVISFFESLGKARAAAELARAGRHDAAAKLLSE